MRLLMIMEVLDYCEYIIPVLFLIFTHFIDEKVHKHWENANYYSAKGIKLIHLYQWELCFLVISLIAILGIKIGHHDFEAGIGIFTASIVLIICLIVLAWRILENDEQKMNAKVFYTAWFLYLMYISTDLYFLKLKYVTYFGFHKEYIFLIAFVFFLISFIWLKRFIDARLFTPILRQNDMRNNISVYQYKGTDDVKRKEALYFILKQLKDEKKQKNKIKKWLERGKKDLPEEIGNLKEDLDL